MSASDFFSRWSSGKQEAAPQPALEAVPEAVPVTPEELPPPTMEDVAALTHDADFRRFVAPGVDDDVRRSAMKKLFSDPQFNVMDGLDIYIDDYNKFEPLPAAMLAMLVHAKPLLDPLGHLQQPAMRLLDLQPAPAPASEIAGEQALEQALPATGDDVPKEHAFDEPSAPVEPRETPRSETDNEMLPADTSPPLQDSAAP